MSQQEPTVVPTLPRRRIPAAIGRHKALSVIFVVVVVLCAAVGGWVVYLNSQLGDISRFPLQPSTPGSPARVPGSAENILLVGVDNPVAAGDLFAALRSKRWDPGVYRSDAVLVLHIDADRRQAQVVSIPRDSYVEVPNRGKTKINASFSDGGPSELTQVVERLSGVHIDHAVVIDFDDFADMTTAIGGVDVTIPQTVHDPENDVTWDKGQTHLEGKRALLYVRQRYGLPRGDFDRIDREQNLLRAMLTDIASAGTLANPIRVTRLVGELSDFVAVDDGFTPSALRSLAISCRHLNSGDVRFVTIPTTGTPTIEGASVVTVDYAGTRQLFKAVLHDDFEQWYRQQTVVHELPAPNDVS